MPDMEPEETQSPSAASTSRKFVVCLVGERRFGLDISKVDRVVRSVEVTPVLDAPPAVLGVAKVKREVVPVVSVRQCFQLPEREIEVNDQLVIARASHGPIALLVDEVAGLVDCRAEDIVPVEDVLQEPGAPGGIARTADGLVIVEDPAKFLSHDDAGRMSAALAASS